MKFRQRSRRLLTLCHFIVSWCLTRETGIFVPSKFNKQSLSRDTIVYRKINFFPCLNAQEFSCSSYNARSSHRCNLPGLEGGKSCNEFVSTNYENEVNLSVFPPTHIFQAPWNSSPSSSLVSSHQWKFDGETNFFSSRLRAPNDFTKIHSSRMK